MTKQELFGSRVHEYAARLFADRTKDPESVAQWAVEYVRAVDEWLAEIPHAEEPAPAPLAWRPMSEFGEATGDIVVAFQSGRRVCSCVYDAQAYVREAVEDCDLAWLQLPPLPTSKL